MKSNTKSVFQAMKDKFNEKCTVDKILMDSDNRMLRLGIGRNDGHKSFRLDLWSVGYRINSRSKKEFVKNTASKKTVPSKVYGMFKLDTIFVDNENTVIRIGYGKHKGTKFFRLDFWSVAYRVTKNTSK